MKVPVLKWGVMVSEVWGGWVRWVVVVVVARCIGGGAEFNRQKNEDEKTSLPNHMSAPHFLTVIFGEIQIHTLKYNNHNLVSV